MATHAIVTENTFEYKSSSTWITSVEATTPSPIPHPEGARTENTPNYTERPIITLPPDAGQDNTGSYNNETERNGSESSNDTTTELLPSEQAILNTITGINAVLVAACLLLNTAVTIFYWKNSTHLVSILYFRNGVADLLCGLGFLLQIPVLPTITSESTFNTVMAISSYFITTVAVRLSVFSNCLIGVSRCINIARPFYQIRRTLISIFTLLYGIIWASVALIDVYWFLDEIGIQNNMYMVKSLVLKPEVGFGLVNYLAYGELENMMKFVLMFVPSFIIPVLLCFVLMLVQIYYLSNSVALDKSANRRPAITILMLTSIYVSTNIAGIIAWISVYSAYLGVTETKTMSWVELDVVYWTASTCPLLCSTFTPLTLCLRARKGENSLVRFLRRGCKHALPIDSSMRSTMRSTSTKVED